MDIRLTVGQFIQLYQISKTTDDDTEKAIQSVSVATGKTVEEVENMPILEFKAIDRQVASIINSRPLKGNPVSFLKSGRKLYQINYKLSTITAGQHTEVQYWLSNDDWVSNMDKILASIAVPVKRYLWVKLPGKNDSSRHEQVCEDMQQVDFETAYGCVVFFCKLFRDSIKATLPYLEEEMKKTGMNQTAAKKLQTDLIKVLDGYSV